MSSEQRGRGVAEAIDTPSEPTPEAKPTRSASKTVPELSSGEREEVGRRTRPSAVIVHETVREEGERELERSSITLAWSALAAGLSMGFSLVAQGLIHSYLSGVAWGPLLDNFGYSVGFLIVVLGRQQLFTENTLTVILPLLAHPNLHTLWKVIRLWTVVLVANLVGTLAFAFILGHTSLFPAEIQRSFTEIAQHSLRGGFGLTILRGVFAGWLIALMVWLLPDQPITKTRLYTRHRNSDYESAYPKHRRYLLNSG
jgi:formate/nitrite transporter FocA (FNT family)